MNGLGLLKRLLIGGIAPSGSIFKSFHTPPKGYRTIRRLNRSQKWKPARSYQHARDISPYPERPVR